MRAETKLEMDRQRWESLIEEDSSNNNVASGAGAAPAAATTCENGGAAAQAASAGGKVTYARKKLRDNKWETKVYVASTLCAIGRTLLLNEDGMVQELFVQKFFAQQQQPSAGGKKRPRSSAY